MKENILFVILIVVGIGAGFYAGVYVGTDKTEDRYQSAPHRRDTTTTVQEVPQPPRIAEVQNQPRVTPQRKLNADSIFAAGLAQGLEEAQRLFAEYSAPEDTTVSFDTLGTLRHTFDPISRLAYYEFFPAPLRLIQRTITDSIYVPTPDERPWWYTPAIVVSSFAVGYITNDILKK